MSKKNKLAKLAEKPPDGNEGFFLTNRGERLK
jgi:hypothetical protein